MSYAPKATDPATVVTAVRAPAHIRSVRVDPASDLDLSPAQRAEQARKGGRPGQSQHLRDAPKPPIQEELDS
ncbi:hypothetical protein ACWDRX_11960, partial [Streptomyces nigra]